MSSIENYYGGSILAIRGTSHIALYSDSRVGIGNITVSMSFPRILRVGPHFIGYPHFIPDAQILHKKVVKNHNLYVLNEGRRMEPQELASMLSYILYSKRNKPYYTSPVVAGMTEDGKPYICGMDQIGCLGENSFVAAGTAERNLVGFCESLHEADGEEMFVNGAQCFVNSMDRDALSGWGCVGYLIGKDKVVKRNIAMRMD